MFMIHLGSNVVMK